MCWRSVEAAQIRFDVPPCRHGWRYRGFSGFAVSLISNHGGFLTAVSNSHDVKRYYHSTESRWGYRLILGGRRHFGYFPSGEDVSQSESQKLMEERLEQLLALPSGSKVLDAGCGEGLVALHLAGRPGLDVTGIDILAELILRANQNAERTGLTSQIAFSVASFDSLPFADGSFDGVFTMEALVHAADHERVLNEFLRVLKPGGRLVLFEYTLTPYHAMPADARQAFKDVIDGSAMHSLPALETGTFSEILRKAGFVGIKEQDISARIVPMLRFFYRAGLIPYALAKRSGLKHKFVNTMAGVEFYKYRRFWQYINVSGFKPELVLGYHN